MDNLEHKTMRVSSSYNNTLNIKVVDGHFATNHSHINKYIDMTTLKSRRRMAMAAAKSMSTEYLATTIVDTIVCMDGTEVIGAYLASALTDNGIVSMNQHQTIYIMTPEVHSSGQLIFRDNLQPMIKGKNVLLLLASATTGKTIKQSLECIEYYGGIISGISAIFSATEEVAGHQVHTLFNTKDIPDYMTYPYDKCPMCQAGSKIEAIVNSYGYSML
jgi:orotate phosphoribosyltransferase